MCRLRDPNTFANINVLATRHIDLNLQVDFQNHVLKGYATLKFAVHNKAMGELILDTDFLKIHSVSLAKEPNQALEVSPKNSFL